MKNNVAYAQNVQPSHYVKSTYPTLLWMYQPWKGDGKPFRSIRNKIDKEALSEQITGKTARLYAEKAAKQPYNAQVQFQAGYIALKVMENIRDPDNLYNSRDLAYPTEQALGRVPGPYTYEYDRLRFLIDVRCLTGAPLKELGRRLVLHNPQDYDVLFRLVSLLSISNPSERHESIVDAKRLVLLKPDRPSAYAQLGSVYYCIWAFSKSKKDAAKALLAFNGYLRIAPTDDVMQSEIKQLVKQVQNGPQLPYDATLASQKALQERMKQDRAFLEKQKPSSTNSQP